MPDFGNRETVTPSNANATQRRRSHGCHHRRQNRRQRDRIAPDHRGRPPRRAGRPARRRGGPPAAPPRRPRRSAHPLAEGALVVVGADAAEACLAHGLPERAGLILCTTVAWIGNDPTDASMLWPVAIRLRADHVIAVPEGREWLLHRFASAAGDTTPAPVAAAVAGHGGAGASTLALATATAAAREGRRTVLIDLDTTGGGIDTAAGLASQPGWRWPSSPREAANSTPNASSPGCPNANASTWSRPTRATAPRSTPKTSNGSCTPPAPQPTWSWSTCRATAPTRPPAPPPRPTRSPSPSAPHPGPGRPPAPSPSTTPLRLRTGRRPPRHRPRPEPATGAADELELPEWGTLPEDRHLATRLRQGRRPRRRTARRLAAITRHLSAQAPEPAGAGR
ncbi:hypothetical protein GCM10029992_15610 [Glycomyces albus]